MMLQIKGDIGVGDEKRFHVVFNGRQGIVTDFSVSPARSPLFFSNINPGLYDLVNLESSHQVDVIIRVRLSGIPVVSDDKLSSIRKINHR